ncbi:hypothetical protein HPB51_003366 [Rhipicephalus microplus]|uniref:DIX domain-containing protein n=1 Tax=Rhipicephalus microplus TaxID=6941 RepID=A0A9J6D4E5_RHIMP|nr:hypothetical protein HPB51_003366 [Rhipicephalus microplus]
MATVKSGQRQWYELLSGATPQGLLGRAGRQAAPGGEIITPHRFRSFISKKGNHRFFRRSCQEFGTDVVSEEMPDDNEVLSLGGQDPRHGSPAQTSQLRVSGRGVSSARLLKDREILVDVARLIQRKVHATPELDGDKWDEVKADATECFRSWGKRRARGDQNYLRCDPPAVSAGVHRPWHCVRAGYAS